MPELLKERRELDPQFMWDLTSMYATDEEWEKALSTLEESIRKAATFQGRLTDAQSIAAYLDAAHCTGGDLSILLEELSKDEARHSRMVLCLLECVL